MKRILSLLFCLFCLFCLSSLFALPVLAQTGYVTVTGSHLTDATGNTINGSFVSFAPVSSSGQPISFRIYSSGQSISLPVQAPVTNGTFSIQLADTNLTSPQNVCYSVTVLDNASGANLLGPGYSCVQPAYSNSWCSSGSCNFDSYTPALPSLGLISTGPQGAAGPACSTGTGTCNMTVPIVLPGDPTTPPEAATKNYVDVTSHSGVWTRMGTVLYGGATEQYTLQEPTVIYEGSPQIITPVGGTYDKVFKLWFTCGDNLAGLCYAESPDGLTWTRAASPVIATGTSSSGGIIHTYVFHYGPTYYAYGLIPACCGAGIGYYTSPDGLTWTLAHTAVIPNGSSGAWDSNMGNIYVVPGTGTWYAMYEAEGTASNGLYVSGIATSADQGVTWTKYSSNPVLTSSIGGAFGGPEIHQVNGVYYVWGQCNVTTSGTNDNEPSDICRAHSTDFFHWTLDNGGNAVFTRATQDEGPNFGGGQVADPSMVQVGGSTYMFMDATDSQAPVEGAGSLHIKLAIAPYTLAQLVTGNEGNAGAMHDNGTFLNGLHLYDCVNWNNSYTAQTPCPNTLGRFDIGLTNIVGGYEPGINFNSYFNGTNNVFATTGAAVGPYLDITNQTFHFPMVTGTAGAVAPVNIPANDEMTMTPGGTVNFQHGITVGPTGTSWQSGPSAPTGTCGSGSLYTVSTGTLTTTLYVCVAAAWQPVTIP